MAMTAPTALAEVWKCIFAGSAIWKSHRRWYGSKIVKLTGALWPLKCKSYCAQDSGNTSHIQWEGQSHISFSLPVCLVIGSLLWQLPHRFCCFHPLVVCSTGVQGLIFIQLCSTGWISARSAHTSRISQHTSSRTWPFTRPWAFTYRKKNQGSHSCSAVNTVSSDYDPVSAPLLLHSG